MSITNWIEQAKRGSRSALGRLLDKHRPELTRLAEISLDAHLRTKISTSDIVQESLLRAGQRFDQFFGETEEEFSGWLACICRRQLIDAHRRFREAARRSVKKELSHGRLELDGLPGSDERPSGILQSVEEKASLLAGISRLTAVQREIVRLRYVEQLSFRECAARLDTSRDWVRRQWMKIIRELACELGASE